MGFSWSLFSFLFPSEGFRPTPVAPSAVEAARDAIRADLEALGARRQAQEEERKRREERKRSLDLSPPMVEEAPVAYDGAMFSNPGVREPTIRRSVGSARYSVQAGLPETRSSIGSAVQSVQADLRGKDERAFSRRILARIKQVYGGNPVPFYTAAGLSRSAYSKIMSHPERKPAKETVLAMAAALRMTLAEAESLLRLAGYSLSPAIGADIVWRNCFVHGVYGLPEVRSLLAQFAPSSRP